MTEEKLITRSENGLIQLTNHKIRYVSQSFGKASIVSIMLNEVTTIEVHFKSFLPALLIGILLVLTGLSLGVQNQGSALLGLLFAGGLFILYYFLTRKHVVSIYSRGNRSIDFESNSLGRDAIMKFINQVEKAKLSYEKFEAGKK
jgi:hypothetical protein